MIAHSRLKNYNDPMKRFPLTIRWSHMRYGDTAFHEQESGLLEMALGRRWVI